MSERLEALWLAVSAAPEDRLLRDALSDYYRDCGYEHMADAVTATREKVPEFQLMYDGPQYFWHKSDGGSLRGPNAKFTIWAAVYKKLVVGNELFNMRDYPSALAALRDLANAWVKAYRFEDKLS